MKFHLEYFTINFITFAVFQCILEGRRVLVPTEIPASYVKKAEEIVSKSYDHSETFSSVCVYGSKRTVDIKLLLYGSIYKNMLLQSLLVRGMTKNVKINKPMLTNRQKVLSALIRSSGVVVNVRNMVKNIRNITTQTVKGKQIS